MLREIRIQRRPCRPQPLEIDSTRVLMWATVLGLLTAVAGILGAGYRVLMGVGNVLLPHVAGDAAGQMQRTYLRAAAVIAAGPLVLGLLALARRCRDEADLQADPSGTQARSIRAVRRLLIRAGVAIVLAALVLAGV